MRLRLGLILYALALSAPAPAQASTAAELLPGEAHLKNLQRITENGESTEPRWSFDGKWIAFQRRIGECDQTFRVSSDGSDLKRLSNGLGRTSAPFFSPDGERVIFASSASVE